MVRGVALLIWGISCLAGGDHVAQAAWRDSVGSEVDEPAEMSVSRKIPYCSHDGESQYLDLARPMRASRAPMLVFIHGGAWTEGSRDYFSSEIEQAARNGFIAVTIDYRVSGYDSRGRLRNPFPAHLQDVRCAIRWLRSQAVALGGDPGRVGVAGASAGAHLALLAGLEPEVPATGEPWSEYSSSAQAIVNYFGPTDLSALMLENPNLAPTVRTVFSDYWSASPIAYLRKESPPILTLHGTSDETVSYNQALRLQRRATEVNARAQVVTFTGEGHGFSPENRRNANDLMISFFAQIFGNGVKRPQIWPHWRFVR